MHVAILTISTSKNSVFRYVIEYMYLKQLINNALTLVDYVNNENSKTQDGFMENNLRNLLSFLTLKIILFVHCTVL